MISMEQYHQQGLKYRREGKWELAKYCLLKSALMLLKEPADGKVRQKRVEIASKMRELATDCERKEQHQEFCERIVRKWLNTISHDLCIKPPAITLTTRIDGLYGPAGGMYDGDNHRVILPTVYEEEREIVFVLCHELKHAHNRINRIAQTEADCDNYARDFMSRVEAPYDPVYAGQVQFTAIVKSS